MLGLIALCTVCSLPELHMGHCSRVSHAIKFRPGHSMSMAPWGVAVIYLIFLVASDSLQLTTVWLCVAGLRVMAVAGSHMSAGSA